MSEQGIASTSPEHPDRCLLRMEGIDKAYPGVQALEDVDLALQAGEVLALLGENGAGKSTLIKVLGGAVIPDRGSIQIEGRPASISNPIEAQRAGVAIIYQEFNLVPALSARENIFLGQEKSRAGFIAHRAERRQAAGLFERIGVRIDPDALCRDLTVAQQQVVEIAKALSLNARIVVMDEPSATLTLQEVGRLFRVIRDLKEQGIGVIYISHRLSEIFQVADRVMVMRDGHHVATRDVASVSRDELIEMMVGRKLESEFPTREARIGDVILKVANLNRGDRVRDVSFSLRRGEVVGLTGLVGAGRTEAARLIFGADRPDSGSIEFRGARVRISDPRAAIRNGICLLTENRAAEGLVLGQTARSNFGLPNLGRFSRFGWLRQGQERRGFAKYIDSLRIKIPHQEQLARNLSGGNQQKVVLAKWLANNCDVIIFDEPTRGIDVGTKYDIYGLINELAAQGKAILMISSELPEVLGMSDRILVMHEGRITGEITDVAGATQEEIMRLAVA